MDTTYTPIPLDALRSLGLREQATQWQAQGDTDGLTAYRLARPGWEDGEALVNGIIDLAGIAWGTHPWWYEAGDIQAALTMEQEGDLT